MEPLKLKKGHVVVYIALLAAVLAIMMYTRNLAGKGLSAGSRHDGIGHDSLTVAIQISSIGVSTYGDTLGGFCYDMIRQMADKEHLTLKIDAFTQVSGALKKLDEGQCDIVISDTPITAELREKYLFTNPIYPDSPPLVQLADSVTGLPIAKDYPQLDLSLTLQFNQFQSWAVSYRNPVLLDSLNVWIDCFKSTQAFDILVNRYFKGKNVKM